MESILNDIKHMLGYTEDDTSFDSDITMQINAAFGTLTQLGVGPSIGFQITNKDNVWAEYYTDPRLSGVRTYIYLKCKMVFDPPGTGFVTTSMENQIKELEYRLNVVAEYG